MNDKRGQAAMEFLMTYGWAILVVLVAIGALAYFGVLNPGRFLPSSCTVGPGIACEAHKVSANGNIQLLLRNGAGQDWTAATVALPGCTSVAAPWTDGTLYGSATAGVTLTGCTLQSATVGSRYKGRITLAYTDANAIARTVTGDLTTKVE